MKMQCPRCHNTKIQHLYQLNGQYYCRECISFQRVMLDEKRKTVFQKYPRRHSPYSLDFELSESQKNLSLKLVDNYQSHLNSFVLAVCGSGKTEIVFELIQYALSQGHRVCFCIPRKELVKELYQRIKKAFGDLEIGLLYGGCHDHPNAQMIVCTMHQLYRFENRVGFDLMIADEVDAFPFYQNKVLQEIFQRCCLGCYVKMSATLIHEDLQDEEVLIMNRRYHGYDLPVPQMILCSAVLQKYLVLMILKLLKKKFLIFVPNIDMIDYLRLFLLKHRILSLGVSSKHSHNQNNIELFRQGEVQTLITTTLLERGITIEDVHVIVYHCQHPLFDERTLTQIAGRVGRKPNHPTGKVFFLADGRTKGISRCIHSIKHLNTMNV